MATCDSHTAPLVASMHSRTVENRDRGFGDSAAVIRGLVQTGGIITAAGLIMTLAFGGLLLSSQPALV